MIDIGEKICPLCGGNLRYHDSVSRIVRTKYRRTQLIIIRRLQCTKCHTLHRKLPNYIYRFKQYERDVIDGVVEGYITSDTLDFEDYPCELTMKHWLNTRK